MYLPGVTIHLQVHHHVVLYVSARGHNRSTTTSPYCTLRLCPGSQSFYNYITILGYFTSLPGVTIILQVHHHSLLYVSTRGHNPPTGTSPYYTLRLCPGSQSFYNITIVLYVIITTLYLTSLSAFTNPLQVHHHTVRYVSARGPTHTTILEVHHHTVLHVSARGNNSSTRTSPYCALLLWPRSQSLYKCITILYFTSLLRLTILLHVHHHNVLCVSARGHNSSISTISPHCT